MRRLGWSLLFLALSACLPDAEKVTFYPTYGYLAGGEWIIPIRAWVHEDREVAESVVARIGRSLGDLDPREQTNFRHRLKDLVADSESGEKVVIRFDGDPEGRDYRIEDENGEEAQTDPNGLIEGLVRLSAAGAGELRGVSTDGWLSFRATSSGHEGRGRVILLEPEGLSVISDIDDTIKVTEIPAGNRIVVRNTFFRDFVPAAGMHGMYAELGDASFHYVSGGPWQLFGPLAEFMFDADVGFPAGTFHMKNLRKNLLSADSWEDLAELARGDATVRQKLSQVSEIVERFPRRRFILIGDSGEKDPEVFRAIRDSFPGQIVEIRIRDVVNARETPGRLDGMTVIEAPTIRQDRSQLDSRAP